MFLHHTLKDVARNGMRSNVSELNGSEYNALERSGSPERVVSLAPSFNDWGGRGYDDFVLGDGTKTTPSGDRTT